MNEIICLHLEIGKAGKQIDEAQSEFIQIPLSTELRKEIKRELNKK